MVVDSYLLLTSSNLEIEFVVSWVLRNTESDLSSMY